MHMCVSVLGVRRKASSSSTLADYEDQQMKETIDRLIAEETWGSAEEEGPLGENEILTSASDLFIYIEEGLKRFVPHHLCHRKIKLIFCSYANINIYKYKCTQIFLIYTRIQSTFRYFHPHHQQQHPHLCRGFNWGITSGRYNQISGLKPVFYTATFARILRLFEKSSCIQLQKC